jgi:hypothetical protein
MASADQEYQLPDLRFVPIECLMPHERHDPHRLQSLVKRIREQAVLNNPPFVIPFSAEHDVGL